LKTSSFRDEILLPPYPKEIIADTLCFDFPVVEVEKGIYSLELFHGPNDGVQDVGAVSCRVACTSTKTKR
jgi:hypothetical protein